MTTSASTFELAPEPGARVVGDHYPGRGPGLLFLHGLGSARSGDKSTALKARTAAQGRAFTRFDFRAHGDSSSTLTEVTMGDFIKDGETVLRHVGRSVLVGSSLGGLVATWLARRVPELVHALVLIAPAFGFLPRMRARLSKEQSIRLTDGREIVIQRRFLADAEAFDESGLPGSIDVPVLIAHGTADDVVPVDVSQTFFANCASKRKELMLIPGGDHRLTEVSASIFDRMDKFLETLDLR